MFQELLKFNELNVYFSNEQAARYDKIIRLYSAESIETLCGTVK